MQGGSLRSDTKPTDIHGRNIGMNGQISVWAEREGGSDASIALSSPEDTVVRLDQAPTFTADRLELISQLRDLQG
jgi:hypothetical protein